MLYYCQAAENQIKGNEYYRSQKKKIKRNLTYRETDLRLQQTFHIFQKPEDNEEVL